MKKGKILTEIKKAQKKRVGKKGESPPRSQVGRGGGSLLGNVEQVIKEGGRLIYESERKNTARPRENERSQFETDTQKGGAFPWVGFDRAESRSAQGRGWKGRLAGA